MIKWLNCWYIYYSLYIYLQYLTFYLIFIYHMYVLHWLIFLIRNDNDHLIYGCRICSILSGSKHILLMLYSISSLVIFMGKMDYASLAIRLWIKCNLRIDLYYNRIRVKHYRNNWNMLISGIAIKINSFLSISIWSQDLEYKILYDLIHCLWFMKWRMV